MFVTLFKQIYCIYIFYSDTKEVKVMSDLAMIAAGEVPMEVDRVSCFSSAVIAFSPLLFGLNPTDGFQELLDSCKEVWENVENDKSILKKWVSIHCIYYFFLQDYICKYTNKFIEPIVFFNNSLLINFYVKAIYK